MKKNYKLIDAIYSDNHEDNIDKYGYSAGPQCHCCGIPLKNDNYLLHMTTDGKIVPENVNEEDVEDSQGWFEIGPECQKKYPSEYIYKRK